MAKPIIIVMKEIISKQNCASQLPPKMIVNGTETNNKTDIANAFNKYFKNVGPNLAAKIKTHPNLLRSISSKSKQH